MRRLIVFGLLFGFLGIFGSLKPVSAEMAMGKMDMAASSPITVKGEIIDSACYLGMGAKGLSHKQCGIDCVKAGTPVAILEEGTGKIYVLMSNKDKTPLPQAVIDKMGETTTIKGTLYTAGGSQIIAVDSVE